MRVLFTALPIASHIRDVVPLAYTARALGHDVLLSAPEVVSATVAGHGLPFRCAGYDWVSEPMAEMGARREVMPEEIDAFMMPLIMEMFPGEPAARMAEGLAELIADWRPDVVVRDACEFGAYLAAERAGLPHVSLGTVSGCADFLDEAIGAALQATAEGMGFEEKLGGIYRYLHVNLVPDRFDPGELGIPTMHGYRAELPHVPGERLPAWVTELDPARPTVLAGFGTMSREFAAWEQVAEAIIEGLGLIDANGDARAR